MKPVIRIGTRDSKLALWQAEYVMDKLKHRGHECTLVPIKSDGDIDLNTPLYEMGVQGIFTKALDAALLNLQIDIAVHSMKDVPTVLPPGLYQAAVLERGDHTDIFIPNPSIDQDEAFLNSIKEKELDILDVDRGAVYTIATSSIRRKAQWLNRYPHHNIVNLRGNVIRRLEKLDESNWDGAIMAAAGVERINVRPSNAITLNWMLPAPAQGAITITARAGDDHILDATAKLDDETTRICTKIERDFLRGLMGGCSTPISALAVKHNKEIYFRGNLLSVDGKKKIEIEKYTSIERCDGLGTILAGQLLKDGGQEIADENNGR